MEHFDSICVDWLYILGARESVTSCTCDLVVRTLSAQGHWKLTLEVEKTVKMSISPKDI